MKHAIPKHCGGCRFLWTHGVKDGTHDRWCCKYSKTAPDALGQCNLKGGKEVNEKRNR